MDCVGLGLELGRTDTRVKKKKINIKGVTVSTVVFVSVRL